MDWRDDTELVVGYLTDLAIELRANADRLSEFASAIHVQTWGQEDNPFAGTPFGENVTNKVTRALNTSNFISGVQGAISAAFRASRATKGDQA